MKVRDMSSTDIEASIDYAKYVLDTVGLEEEDYKEAREDLVLLESEMLRRIGMLT